MMVKIALFASARDIVGAEVLDLNVDETATLEDVKLKLAQQFPELMAIIERSMWAVDHEYVDGSTLLHESAEIGLIPPVSGG